jgi:hypothetical protein
MVYEESLELSEAYRLSNRNSLFPGLEELDELLSEGLEAWRREFGHGSLLMRSWLLLWIMVDDGWI